MQITIDEATAQIVKLKAYIKKKKKENEAEDGKRLGILFNDNNNEQIVVMKSNTITEITQTERVLKMKHPRHLYWRIQDNILYEYYSTIRGERYREITEVNSRGYTGKFEFTK